MVDSSAAGHEELDCTKDLGPCVSDDSVKKEKNFGLTKNSFFGLKVRKTYSKLFLYIKASEFEPI